MAKKKNESENKLEKICEKLEAVPLEKWHSHEHYFYTNLGEFEFRMYGSVDDSGSVNEVSVGVYAAATERHIVDYEYAPRLYDIFKKLAEQETEKTEEDDQQRLNDFIDS